MGTFGDKTGQTGLLFWGGKAAFGGSFPCCSINPPAGGCLENFGITGLERWWELGEFSYTRFCACFFLVFWNNLLFLFLEFLPSFWKSGNCFKLFIISASQNSSWICTYMIYLYLVLLALVFQQDLIPPAPAFWCSGICAFKIWTFEIPAEGFLPGKAMEKKKKKRCNRRVVGIHGF